MNEGSQRNNLDSRVVTVKRRANGEEKDEQVGMNKDALFIVPMAANRTMSHFAVACQEHIGPDALADLDLSFNEPLLTA